MTYDPNTQGDSGGGQSGDDNTWGMLAHLGAIVLGFIAPLIVMLTKGNQSPFVRTESVESLNFQITLAIGYLVASLLSAVLIGLLLFPVLLILQVVFPIIGGLAANKGQNYRYPFALRLVK